MTHHWNGEPAGQGLRILEIISRPGGLRAIKAGLEASMPINGRNLSLYSADWCPSLHHGIGAEVLELIQSATPMKILPLYLDYAFVTNTAYCEHAYVLDLDGGVLEIYIGQIPGDRVEHPRFKPFAGPTNTCPRFITAFSLSNLPLTPDDFLGEIAARAAERDAETP
ncbi:hypothetical protein KEM52_005513 [Ascosphaera acerosa]|nr:hypothetical protein KEM52_005513 [Ascosphaera acerosa]